MKHLTVLVFLVAVFGMICVTACADVSSQAGADQANNDLGATFVGVSVADDFPDYDTPQAAAWYDSLSKSGISWIVITPCGFVRTITDTVITWEDWSRRDYVAAIKLAHAHNLKVLVKPYLWSMDFWYKKQWTGDITFDNAQTSESWIRSYTEFLADCARMAEEGKAEALSIGCELPGLTKHTEAWKSAISQIRLVYSGSLTYSAHGIAEAMNVSFWTDLDLVGINLYPTLSNSDSATLEELVGGWQETLRGLDTLAAKTGRKILITELGFRSVEKGYYKPWEWPEHNPRPVNYEHQRLSYQASAKVLYNQPWLQGVFWWKVFTNPDQSEQTKSGFTPQGKPAWNQLVSDAQQLRKHPQK